MQKQLPASPPPSPLCQQFLPHPPYNCHTYCQGARWPSPPGGSTNPSYGLDMLLLSGAIMHQISILLTVCTHLRKKIHITMLQSVSIYYKNLCPDAMIQELTKSSDVEALEESYVKRFSHMPKVTFQSLFVKNYVLSKFLIMFCVEVHDKYIRNITGRPKFLLPFPQ